MLKNILWLVLTLMLSGLYAQDAASVVVVSCNGKAKYTSADGKTKTKLEPGSVIQKTGSVKVKRKGKILLYADGNFQSVEGKVKQQISALYPESGGMRKMGFDTEFGKYIEAAVMLAAGNQGSGGFWNDITDDKGSGDGWASAAGEPGSAETSGKKKTGDGWGNMQSAGSGPGSAETSGKKKTGDGWGNRSASGEPGSAETSGKKKTGDGWGNQSASGGPGSAETSGKKKTGDGWGNSGLSFEAIMPFGYVSLGAVEFKWSMPSGTESCILEIRDSKQKEVYTQTVNGWKTTVDLKAANCKVGEIYVWRVRDVGNNDQGSNLLDFGVQGPEAMKEATNKASKSKIHDGYVDVIELLKAVSLERSDWFYDADQTYERLLKKDPENKLVRMMYAAFLTRYGYGDFISQL